MMTELKPELALEFKQKTVTPDEAVKVINSGDTVYIGTCSSVAHVLCEALGERSDELENVRITGALIQRPMGIYSGNDPKAFKAISFFMGPQERNMYTKGLGEYTSIHLSQVDIFCKETAPARVAFMEVSEPDEDGYMSYGATGVALHKYVAEKAEIIILQVNKNVPSVYGEDNKIHISQANMVVFADDELSGIDDLLPDDSVKKVSDFLIEQIPDGACIQLGLGGISNAVGYGLMNKTDLGAHTEVMSESFMHLMEAGVMNNSRKTYMPGKTVASFTFGSKKLYEFIDHNENMYYAPFPVVNDVRNIAKNDNMISINTALAIDLTGQVCADNIAGRQYSGVGGQIDFVRGSQLSKGGKSFIAINSSYNDKKKGLTSKIVPRLPELANVTTPRSEVQYVVTEHGCINLKPLTNKARTLALIELAAPEFRAELTEEAKRIGLI
ncbi:MAG: acetyl-CoA hydrolase/transferase C-terminal domain-containing protein [Clostridia bacterium]|nr:acetyl-CoA hydrolase/transferase C-terminal domain-containing protein [Clostridia bacterium]